MLKTYLGIVILITVVAGIGCKRETSSAVDPRKKPLESLEDHLEERNALDEDVWKQEKLAQFYEQRIVKLWDELRQSPDKLEVLSKVPLKEILVPSETEATDLGGGVRQRTFGGSLVSHPAEAFRSRLAELTGSDVRLVQSEWHHQSFEMKDSDGETRSEVTFSLHLHGEDGQKQTIVKGILGVTWEEALEEDQIPEPSRVEVNSLSMLERTGTPAFEQVGEIDARDLGSRILSVQPLLVYDLNGDGLSEVILGGVNLVHWNLGGGAFKRAPLLKFWPGEISESALLADFTGDGWADFLCIVGQSRKPVLFPGNSEGKFEQPGIPAASVTFQNPSVLTAGDIDGDGDLDCWMTQYKPPYVRGQMPTPYYDANDGFPSYLLLNTGQGRFVDVTEERGLAQRRMRRTYSSSFIDLDHDQDLDLVVVSDFAGVDLYQNDGKGNFSDVRDQWIDEWHNFGMAHTFGDYDRDGLLDMYVIGMSSTTARRLDQMGLQRTGFEKSAEQRSIMGFGNRMYLQRKGRFEEPAFRAQVARTGWAWGCSTFDFENDGDQDIYVANGHISGSSAQDYCSTFWRHDLYTGSSLADPIIGDLFNHGQATLNKGEISWNGFEKNALLMNRDGTGFENVGFLMNVALSRDCRGVVSDDLNGDGLVDLLVVEEWSKAITEKGQILHVYMNQNSSENNWIGIRLQEQGRPGHALGGQVTLRSKQGTQLKTIVTGDSFFSQHPPVAHFGIGKETSVDQVEIRWPDGHTTVLKQPETGRYHTVYPDQ